jgi:hypothetical protein
VDEALINKEQNAISNVSRTETNKVKSNQPGTPRNSQLHMNIILIRTLIAFGFSESQSQRTLGPEQVSTKVV